jgi:hypothetical protein
MFCITPRWRVTFRVEPDFKKKRKTNAGSMSAATCRGKLNHNDISLMEIRGGGHQHGGNVARWCVLTTANILS